MEILFITGGFPSPDKPAKSIFNLRAALALKDLVEIRVVHFRAWRPGRPWFSSSSLEGLPVFSLALPFFPWPSADYAALVPVWRVLARRSLARFCGSADVIHSVGVDLGGLIGSDLSLRFGIPHVAQATGSDLLFHLPRLASRPWLRKWVDGVEIVLCNSDALRVDWNRQYPNGSSAVVVRRGTDLARYRTDTLPEAKARRFLFLGGYANRSSTGFGVDLKGAVTLMEAWSRLDLDPGFSGQLCFGGPNSAHRNVRAWRSALRFPERVRLIGELDPTDVPASLGETDVVLMPSRSEGLPNLAVEAAAATRVVFGSAVGGVPEAVHDRETGLLLPPGDSSAWQEAIRDATHGRFPLGQWARAARSLAKREFDQSHYPHALHELYSRITRLERPRG